MGKHKPHQQQQQQQQAKRRQTGVEDDWEAVLKEAKATATHQILLTAPNKLNLALVALYMTSLPVVFFYTSLMFELSLAEYALQFIGITVVSGLLLLHAYIQIASFKEDALLRQRDLTPKGKLTKEEKAAWQASLVSTTTNESLSYSLFVTNATYLALFCLLAFYASPKYEVAAGINQLLSTLLPAVVLAARPRFFVW